MMSIVAWQQLKGLSRKKKKHSEFHVEDSGNIRNRHAMPNFKGKGIMYDETNKQFLDRDEYFPLSWVARGSANKRRL